MGEQGQAAKIAQKAKKLLQCMDTTQELAKGRWWNPGQICDIKDALAEFVGF